MNERGVTLLELLVTMSIILVLASVALPLQKMTSKRSQELELRQKLREMRMAIDEFRRDWARDGDIMMGPLCTKNKQICKDVAGIAGYPKSMKVLLGVDLSGGDTTAKAPEKDKAKEKEKDMRSVRRYLRRIPLDPLTGTADWALRCYQDPPDIQQWCGEDVFDVSSTSLAIGLDGVRYRDW